jgi:hypothetical protein
VGSILAGVYMLVGPIAAVSVNRLVVELNGWWLLYSPGGSILAGVYLLVSPIAAVSVNRLVV